VSPERRQAGSSARAFAGLRLAACAVACALLVSSRLLAHPAPFSYVNLHIQPGAVDVTLVIHVYDLAHELGIEPAESLMAPGRLAERADQAIELLRGRFQLEVNGIETPGDWLDPVPSAETDAVLFRTRYPATAPVDGIRLTTHLFPYDPIHQTFINVYDREQLRTQAILDASNRTFTYSSTDNPGALAALRQFLPAGIHHILIGPDHLLFLFGLLLLGGTIRRLALVVTAFTLAHSLTLSLAALGHVTPPADLIEPAIALSIVYVGIDNLLVGRGRDTRAWIAFVFGLIHGFGFANVLAEMALPRGALVWSLVSFNLGVEVGQLLVVVLVAGALALVRRRSSRAGQQIVRIGSVAVIVAGAYWFVERVFLRGGV
jgi:hydrogenase/urease accessory protein HupE